MIPQEKPRHTIEEYNDVSVNGIEAYREQGKTFKGREIKFRVFDKEENKYFEPIYEAYKGRLLDLSIGLGGDIIRRTLEYCAEHESKFPDRYVLEQFIGLQDRNRDDIYEGDVLAVGDLMIVIEYKGNCFHGRYLKAQKAFWPPLENKNYLQWKIIGNIHQDAHLLT